jgi:hypothetical protein
VFLGASRWPPQIVIRYPAEAMSRAQFSNFAVDLPPGWGDITDHVEADNTPATVARDDGVGALQFSIGLYESGPRPLGSVEELQELLHGFAQSRGLTSPNDTVRENSPRGLVAASFEPGDDFLRVWYISEGGNFAFVTYTSDRANFDPRELSEVEKIVRSLIFGEPAAG